MISCLCMCMPMLLQMCVVGPCVQMCMTVCTAPIQICMIPCQLPLMFATVLCPGALTAVPGLGTALVLNMCGLTPLLGTGLAPLLGAGVAPAITALMPLAGIPVLGTCATLLGGGLAPLLGICAPAPLIAGILGTAPGALGFLGLGGLAPLVAALIPMLTTLCGITPLVATCGGLFTMLSIGLSFAFLPLGLLLTMVALVNPDAITSLCALPGLTEQIPGILGAVGSTGIPAESVGELLPPTDAVVEVEAVAESAASTVE